MDSMGFGIPPLEILQENLERLPGLGRKTAQRLTFHVLNMPKNDAIKLANAILQAREKIHNCAICKSYTDQELCPTCRSPKRDRSIVCVVENAQDVMSFERTKEYNGLYHVLHGLISPQQGIGPDQIFIKELMNRVEDGSIKEIIMATNPTLEGEATAMYIAQLLKPKNVKVTRLAYGMPYGGNLDYADEVTLYRSLQGRNEI